MGKRKEKMRKCFSELLNMHYGSIKLVNRNNNIPYDFVLSVYFVNFAR